MHFIPVRDVVSKEIPSQSLPKGTYQGTWIGSMIRVLIVGSYFRLESVIPSPKESPISVYVSITEKGIVAHSADFDINHEVKIDRIVPKDGD